MFKRDNLGAHASNKKDQVCNHRFPRAHTPDNGHLEHASNKEGHMDERLVLVASLLAARTVKGNKFGTQG